ncbi:MAG: sugar kinase [Hyphomicrobiales bacterium]|nr:sugar kinase [Hyphomicrobiales bacterium]OQW81273.1 MAG: ribokinase [Proteobacteria bacterium ST_bin15]
MSTVIAVGEVMIELNHEGEGRYHQAFGGDTFNTAVYLARLGVDVGYATALGDDRFSDHVLALAASEGVKTDAVLRVPGRMPGLYVIDTNDRGERSFSYWRDTSPARDLFELTGWQEVAERVLAAKLIYLSAITLSLYRPTGLGRLLAMLEEARKQGCLVAFDSNFRPRGWQGDFDRARLVIGEALKRCDIALPTFDDEQILWSDRDPLATIERLVGLGISEVVVKSGADSAWVASKAGIEQVPCPQVVTPVDTTAAGDSFSAAYLAARLAGAPPRLAADAGHRLAGAVIQHRGAIIPRETTIAALSPPKILH